MKSTLIVMVIIQDLHHNQCLSYMYHITYQTCVALCQVAYQLCLLGADDDLL